MSRAPRWRRARIATFRNKLISDRWQRKSARQLAPVEPALRAEVSLVAAEAEEELLPRLPLLLNHNNQSPRVLHHRPAALSRKRFRTSSRKMRRREIQECSSGYKKTLITIAVTRAFGASTNR